jgi:hypothetical protein
MEEKQSLPEIVSKADRGIGLKEELAKRGSRGLEERKGEN